jgi:hypothetical protein
MSPRIIQLPLSGRDRRHYVRELRAAEQAHRDPPAKVEEAYRAAHALACHEWNVRQFIGGPAEPSPRIADGARHVEMIFRSASRRLSRARARMTAMLPFEQAAALATQPRSSYYVLWPPPLPRGSSSCERGRLAASPFLVLDARNIRQGQILFAIANCRIDDPCLHVG